MASEVAGADRAGEAPKTKVFISYSRKNMAFADRFEAALEERGFEPLIDRTEIYAFEDWWKRIQALIAQADTVVFVLSPDSVGSDVCAKEVAYAASLNKRFAPIVFQRVEDKLVPEALARLNFIFFDDTAKFDDSLTRLCEALATDIGWIRKHTEFGEAARHWTAGGRPNGLLLRSPLLEEAERWIASRPPNAPAPTEETQIFVTESRRGATRRRNILTGSLAAGLIVALALAGLAYWQRGIAVEERQHAVTALNAATRASNNLIYDLAGRFRNQTGVPSALVKDIIGHAQKLQDELFASGQTSADLRHSQASALMEIALTLQTIGDRPGALDAAERSRQILEDLLAASPQDAALQLDLGVTYGRIGDVLEHTGKLNEAFAAYEKARDLHQVLVGSDPANEKAQDNLAVDYGRIGRFLREEEKLDDALAAYQKSLSIMQSLVQGSQLNADWRRDLGIDYENIGSILLQQNKLDQAYSAFQQRLQIAQFLVNDTPTNTEYQRNLSVAYNKLGDVLLAQSKTEDAINSYQNGLAIRQALSNGDPSNLIWLRDVAISNNLIAAALQSESKFDDALAAFERGRTIERRLASADPKNVDWQRDLFLSDLNIGVLLGSQDKLDVASKEFLDSLVIAVERSRANPGAAFWQHARQLSVSDVGVLVFNSIVSKKVADALTVADQAIAIAPEVVVLYAKRAHALMFLGRTDEARAIYLQHLGEKNIADGKSWEDVILGDFAQFRKGGFVRPLMDEITKRFADSR
jgi:tetratricopeptide (TPR) repeat protein